MKKEDIKVAFCAAYDWEYLKISLPLVYQDATKICIAVDKDRISWTGKPFDFDSASFYEYIRQVDTENKIDVYEDDFHKPELTPMANEVLQRNMMAKRLGNGGWHIQLDTDEYFIDFPGFVSFLEHYKSNWPVNITCPLYTMYKQLPDGCLFITSSDISKADFIAVATKFPHYEFGRRNGNFNVKTEFVLLHQSWARPEEEILQKINNWGHKDDFDVISYYNRWKQLSNENYRELRNFHPIHPEAWEHLEKVPGNITELIARLRQTPPFTFNRRQLRQENSLWRSRFKFVIKRIKK